jgi:hypothetical protein
LFGQARQAIQDAAEHDVIPCGIRFTFLFRAETALGISTEKLASGVMFKYPDILKVILDI